MSEASDSGDLSCKKAARLMSRQQDAALDAIEIESLKHHLYVCLSCRRFEDQLLFLRRVAQRYADG
jgi:hypothetical protein